MQTSSTIGRGKHVSLACSACRSRKSKCSGSQPCSLCIEKNTQCIFDKATDRRRTGHTRRRVDDAELLQQLVRAISISDDAGLVQLRALTNRISTTTELSGFVQTCLEELERRGEPTGPVLMTSESSSVSPIAISLSPLDAPWRAVARQASCQVPAKPWTSVTADDELVSHLITLWFEWSHGWESCLDRKRFLAAAQRQDENSQFCSPFLVNAILAEACFISDLPETRPKNGHPSRMCMLFYERARNLNMAEEGKTSLCMVQGLLSMARVAMSLGKDRVGWIYNKLAAGAMEEYAECVFGGRPLIADVIRIPELDEVIDITLWGCFGATSMFASFFYHQPPMAHTPRRPMLRESANDVWTPYPFRLQAEVAHAVPTSNAFFSLAALHNEIYEVMHRMSWLGESGAQLAASVDSLHKRILLWKHTLPRPISEGNLVLPHILTLHATYHATIMSLYGRTLDKLPDAPVGYVSRSQAAQWRASAAIAFSQVITTFRANWSLDFLPVCLVHETAQAALILMYDLRSSPALTAFVELCWALRTLADRRMFAVGLLRCLQLSSKQNEVNCPSEISDMFGEFEENVWSKTDASQFSSMWPLQADASPQAIVMDRLLQADIQ